MEESVTLFSLQNALKIKELHKRFLIFSSREPEEEFEEIHLQHAGLIHLNIPLKGGVTSEIRDLAHLQNAEALIAYGDWMNEELEAILHTFLPDQIDEYQLEAKIKDFRHEVENPLLLAAKKSIKESVLLEEGVAKEKKVLKARLTMQASLQTQKEALKAVVEGIEKIEKAHSELLPTKWKVITLVTILENLPEWDLLPATLWTQLLCDQLGVFCCVDKHHAEWTFALRTSMAKLYKRYFAYEILNTLENWGVYLQEVKRLYLEKGKEEFHLWSLSDRGPLQPLITFRTYVLEQCGGKALPDF